MTLSPYARRLAVTLLLALSAANLTLMVPGGPVETRDFSAYSPLVLGAFNIFLTVLGIGSFVIAGLQIAGRIRAPGLAGLCGLGFLAVYVADLAGIFPVSPVAMPPLLSLLEQLGTVLALLLIGAAILAGSADPGRNGASGKDRGCRCRLSSPSACSPSPSSPSRRAPPWAVESTKRLGISEGSSR